MRLKKKALVGLAAVSIAVLIAAPMAVTALAIDERLLFFPAKYPTGDWEPADLEFEDVWIPTPAGTAIHGWYCPSAKPIATVLYLHGNAGNLAHRAPLLRRLQRQIGVSTLIVDYRGYGRSEGSPSVASVIEDARTAREFLARKADIPTSEVVLMGRSLGGAVAVALAAEAPPRGLVVESSFSSLKDVASHHYPVLAWLVSPSKLNSSTGIEQFTGPFLQSHGDADLTIPFELGQKLFAAANEPKQFMSLPGGAHNDESPDAYYAELRRFIEDLPR